MALTLTTPFTLANGTRLIITSARPDDDAQILNVSFELRTTVPGGDLVISRKEVSVRNGVSDRIKRNAAPAAGTMLFDLLLFEQQVLSTPTGYTDAINAWRAAATPAARRAALEALGLTAGWIDASLAGT
jgi:hypothetical protein